MAEKEVFSHLRVFLPKANQYPLEKAKEWADNYYKNIRHISGHCRKSVHTQKAYREKIAQPMIEEYRKLLEHGLFAGNKGLSPAEIMAKIKSKTLSSKAARAYLSNLGKAYRVKDGVRAKRVKENLPYNAADYAIEMTFGAWRFIGPLGNIGKAPFVLAEDWLSGKPETAKLLREQDELIKGEPVLITEPGKAGIFKRRLPLFATATGDAQIISLLLYERKS
jgi:hypothetical protein